MEIERTHLHGLVILKPKVFRDSRGFFTESYNHLTMGGVGIPSYWAQDNMSVSHRNVVRGLHYQLSKPQGKLVRCVFGIIMDVAVDLRRYSPTYGQHFSKILNSVDGELVWIPQGFAHGFCVLSEAAGVAYKVTAPYHHGSQKTILWNTPELEIDWPIAEKAAVLSQEDSSGTRFFGAEVFE